jgi:hypothetical protein
MDVDYSDYAIEDYKINGFKKALVEDSEDPLDAGRIRIRILGIHSMDPVETPITHLPWAEPAISISYSGGFNTKDIKSTVKPVGRYAPSVFEEFPSTPMPDKQTTKLITIQEWQDDKLLNCGTGGKFDVPAKGSIVWIFFDDGCHLYPKYIAMAVDARDWKTQKEKISNEVYDKAATATNLLKFIEIDKVTHVGTGVISSKIKIGTPIETPIIDIGNRFFTENYLNLNSKVSSWTSPGGTTCISVHENEKEKLYVMHKGYLEYTDEFGQRTTIVGTTNPIISNPITPNHSSGKKNDETNIVAGNKKVYILGDMSVYVKNNCFIQCEKTVNINAKDNVGIVSRNGNINILAENSDINMSAPKSNLNFSAKNIQFSADQDIIMKSKVAIDISSTNISTKAEGTILSEAKKLNFTSLSESILHSNGKISLLSNGTISSKSVNDTSFSSSFTSFKSIKSISLSAPNFIVSSNIVSIKADKSNINSDVLINSKIMSVNAASNMTLKSGGPAAFNGSIVNLGGPTTNILGNVTLGIGTPGVPSPVINLPSDAVSEPTKAEAYVKKSFAATIESLAVVINKSEIK